MVAVSRATLGADDFERVKDVGDETVGLRDEVVGGAHGTAQTARANQRANEEAAVGRVALGGRVVDVDLAVLDGTRLEVEVGETAELELESERRLDVADGFELLPSTVLLADGVVRRVLALAADQEGDAAHAAVLKVSRHRVDVLGELGAERILVDIDATRDSQSDVEDVPLLLARSGGLLVDLALAGVREVAEHALQLLANAAEGRDREHGAVTDRLRLRLVQEVGQVRVGRGTLRGETGRRRRRLRLGSGLAHAESPGDGRGLVLVRVGFDVLEVEKVVRAVRATNVDLEGGKCDPLVLMLEEGRKDIKDGEAAVDDVLEDLGARSPVVRRVLAVDGRSDRSAQDLLELAEALLERGQLRVNQDLARLERDLGRRLRVEFGETLEDRRDDGLDDREAVALLDKVEEGEDERVLRGRLVVREDDADDRVERVAVGIAELEDDIIVAAAERLLGRGVRSKDAGDGRPLVVLESAAVTEDDVLERGEEVANRLRLGGAERLESLIDQLAALG